jgi:predicted esterase
MSSRCCRPGIPDVAVSRRAGTRGWKVTRRLGTKLAVSLLSLLLWCPPASAQHSAVGRPSGANGDRRDTGSAALQEPAAPPGETVYIDGVSLFPCLVLVPDDYDASRRYPLVVGLHGHGGRADDFFLPAPWFADIGVIYAVPQAPYEFPSLGRIGYSWNLRSFDDEAGDQGADEMTERYILHVIDALSERYSVGDVYLMGFSQGGAFTYTTAIGSPERFKGLAAFGSRFDPSWFSQGELAAANDLRVFIAVGREDGASAASSSARDTLRELGYDVEFFDFDGGHVITRSAIEALLRWLER